MVVPLRPSKFYGSKLPRPRIYTDVKFNDQRVDPPVPVMDPLLSWGNEAHWSMGGLNFQRLRLQGKIEGNVEKLRKEQEKISKKMPESSTPSFKLKGKSSSLVRKSSRKSLDSPPAAPFSRKLRLRSRLIGGGGDEDEEEVSLEGIQKGVETRKRRRLVRKLGDDFEEVSGEDGKSKRSPLKDASNGEGKESGASRVKTRARRTMVLMGEESGDDDAINGENGAGDGMSASKKSGEKGSVSPARPRTSRRLKNKST